MPQYIYLLQEREFIRTKENVYKVGRTTQVNYERFNQYPKGSVLLHQSVCEDCTTIEKKLIIIFKQEFRQCRDYGIEYFEGDYKKMIDIINFIIKKEKDDIDLNNLNINDELENTQNYENTDDDRNEETDSVRDEETDDDRNEETDNGEIYEQYEQEHMNICNDCGISQEYEEFNKSKTSITITKNEENNTQKLYICPYCYKDYEFLSRLKNHLNNSVRCQKDSKTVELILSNIRVKIDTMSKIKKEANYECDKCNTKFTHPNSIYRHKKRNNCSGNTSSDNIDNLPIECILYINPQLLNKFIDIIKKNNNGIKSINNDKNFNQNFLKSLYKMSLNDIKKINFNLYSEIKELLKFNE